MNKQNVTECYLAIIGTSNNVVKPQKHFAKSEKLDAEDQILQLNFYESPS